MSMNRKEFLKITAASAATVAAVGTGIGVTQSGLQASSGHGDAAPEAGKKKWGMVIDTTKCEEGCTKCIDACHSVHNVPTLPPEMKKIEIKWIWKEGFKNLFPSDANPYMSEEVRDKREMLTLCNHCDNPPCVRVCPTQATFKRKSDGIVMMDFHRCIGCRYCMAGCPYGSRSFNFTDPRPHIKEINPNYPTRTKGVVEKCDFCYERLAKGQGFACAEACPSGAIIWGDLNDPESEIRKFLAKNDTKRRKPELGTNPNTFYKI